MLRRLFTTAMIVLGAAVAALSEAGAQQNTGYFIAHSHSWGAKAFVLCEPQGCSDAVAMSHRPLTSLVLGVDRRFKDDGNAHISLGASITRRGWYEGFGRWNQLTTLSLPIMGVAEPFGSNAPLGLSLGVGVSGDMVINRLSESRLSLTGGLWAYARVMEASRISLGVRTSRTLRNVDGLYLRSHVVSVGFSSR